VPLSPEIDFQELARSTEEFTGADLESLCKKATLLAIADYQNGARITPFTVSRGDFLTILDSERDSPKPQKR
jgi:ATP-dependent 26S proteasome regulatory subunit